MAVYTTIDDPEAYFQVKLTTGSGDAQAVTFDGDTDMQPDLIWGKRRDSTGHPTIFDAVRGITKGLETNGTGAEFTSTDYYTAFGSDGFTIAAGASGAGNGSSQTAVQWCWKANGSGSSNEDGSINTTSTSVNTTAGFSISSYTGNGSGSATIGHGLTVAPSFVIIKCISAVDAWQVYSTGATRLVLNVTTADQGSHGITKGATTITTASAVDNGWNGSGEDYIMYCFAEKQGYSKFGSYKGNGNANGTFVFLGFRPAMVIIKKTSDTGNWNLFDNKRDGINASDGNENLFANANDADSVGNNRIDIVSNGFKLKASTADVGTSGGTYVFMAFAESPFVNSKGVPNNAR